MSDILSGRPASEKEDEALLEKLDVRQLEAIIYGLINAGETKWGGGPKKDGTNQFPFAIYPDGVSNCFLLLQQLGPDRNYIEHYQQNCAGVPPEKMSAGQIRTMLTFISRGERLCDGHIDKFVRNGTLLKLLMRLRELLLQYKGKKK